MKRSKKIFAALCATVLAATMCVPAFAEDTGSYDWDNGSNKEPTSIDVELNATLPTPETKYLVTITWQNMTFEYEGAQAKTWNTSTHQYNEDGADGHWTGGGAGGDSAASNITVINHSNADVKVKGEFAYNTQLESEYGSVTAVLTGTLTTAETKLNAGKEGNTDGITGDNQVQGTITVSGTPDKDLTDCKIGTVTVTVSTDGE